MIHYKHLFESSSKGTVDLSKVFARQNRVNLRVALDLVEVGSNPILQMENEDCEGEGLLNTICSDFSQAGLFGGL